MSWDLEYDMVIAGSGVGALTAALAANDAGLSVAVFEKSRLIGGASAITNVDVWIPPDKNRYRFEIQPYTA